MRIKASSIRRIPSIFPDAEMGKKVLVALELVFPEAFAWVPITDRIKLVPHGFTGGEMAIKIIDPEFDPVEPIYIWHPGDPGPIDVPADKLVYRIMLVHKNLAVFACWE
jgi:hypothetical protein